MIQMNVNMWKKQDLNSNLSAFNILPPAEQNFPAWYCLNFNTFVHIGWIFSSPRGFQGAEKGKRKSPNCCYSILAKWQLSTIDSTGNKVKHIDYLVLFQPVLFCGSTITSHHNSNSSQALFQVLYMYKHI